MRKLIFGIGFLILLLIASLSTVQAGQAIKKTPTPTPTPTPVVLRPKLKVSAALKTVKVNVDLGDICWGNVIRVNSKDTFYNTMVRFTSAREGVELSNAYCVSDLWRWIVQQWLRLTTGRFWNMVSY